MPDITIVEWATANNGDNYVKKEVRILSEELELLKTFCETELQMVGNEEEVYMIKTLLKKLEEIL